ncbi:MAG TPA: periplasmic heavy metal sensor [Bacteroidales bacterium]|nr:periplasmic heavy metal sensor [Bacteroidales bacterium]
MDLLSKNRIVFWLLIFLVVVNIAALATYFVHSGDRGKTTAETGNAGREITLSSELSLSPDQSKRVNEVNSRFRENNEPLFATIREKKSAIVEELAKPVTDTALVAKLAAEVGEAQGAVQLSNAKQFLELKKICTPDQTQKLANVYAGLYGCQRDGQGKGPGNGQGRHRHRYGQQRTDSITPQ